MSWSKKYSLFILLIITLGVVLGFMRQGNVNLDRTPDLRSGTLLPYAQALPSFMLIDQDNSPFTSERMRNKWSFVFFGYASCPDICPTTLNTMSKISDLVRHKADTQFLFVSIDPSRDRPERLKEFLSQQQFARTNLVGLTGENTQIKDLAEAIGIYISEVKDVPEGAHIDHSGTILLIDPNNRLSAIFTSPKSPQDISQDFKSVMRYHHLKLKTQS